MGFIPRNARERQHRSAFKTGRERDMRNNSEIRAFCLCCGVLFVFGSLVRVNGAVTSAQRVDVRRIPWDPTKTLRRRLLPSDQTVIVERDSSDILISNRYLSVSDVIEDAAVMSALVAVVNVDRVEGVLSDNESWIQTRLSGAVEQVITARDKLALTGQHIDVNATQGEMTIGGVLVVSTEDPPDDTRYVKLLTTRREYLLFAAQDPETRRLWLVHPPLSIEGGVLKYVWQPRTVWFEPPHPMQGLTLAEVAVISQQARKSWREGEPARR